MKYLILVDSDPIRGAGGRTASVGTGTDLEEFTRLVREKLSAGRQRRDDAFLRVLFQRHCSEDDKLSKDSLFVALSSLNLVAAKDDARLEDLYLEFDLDSDGRISFDEFKAAVLRPSPIEAWCKQIPLWQALADAISGPLGNQEEQPLRAVASLTDAHIDAICAEVELSLRQVLRNEASKLRAAFEAMDAKMTDDESGQSKFSTFKASVGSSDDFHNGLSDRVGNDDDCLLNLHWSRNFADARCSRPRRTTQPILASHGDGALLKVWAQPRVYHNKLPHHDHPKEGMGRRRRQRTNARYGPRTEDQAASGFDGGKPYQRGKSLQT